MDLITNLSDIKAFDERITRACSDIRYPIGSILRIAGQYLANWGIGVTEENKEAIEALSLRSYQDEWKRTTGTTHDAIIRATELAGFERGNTYMNSVVGDVAVDLMFAMAEYDKTRTFRLCDIGAGSGETTKAILDRIEYWKLYELMERFEFTLIEPSRKNLNIAGDKIETHRVTEQVEIKFIPIGCTTHKFLERVGKGQYDLAISSAVFHHMSFPGYLQPIREALAEDGVVVIGDWYTTIWKYPAFVAEVLKRLGIGRYGLNDFIQMFDIREGDASRLEKELTPEQQETNKRMIAYVYNIGNEFVRMSSRMGPEERAEFLEAHEAFDDRIGKLEDAGFVMDLKELKDKHTAFVNMPNNKIRVDPKNDAAMVVAGAKVPGKLRKAA